MCRECLGECARAAVEARRVRSTERIAEAAANVTVVAAAAAAPTSGDKRGRRRRQEAGREMNNVVPHCVCMCVWSDKELKELREGRRDKREKPECACTVLVGKVPKRLDAT